MDDDLLLTNKYLKNEYLTGNSNSNSSGVNYNENYNKYGNSNNSNDKNDFHKLMNAKDRAQTTYSKDIPEFSKEYKIDRDLGINISESSVGLEQYINLGMTDKRKKIKKTVVNIDSRNRIQETIYDKVSLQVRKYSQYEFEDANRPLQFIYDSNEAYLLLENMYIETLEEKQFIIKKINSDFTTVGFTTEDFIFNTLYTKPIIDIIEYLIDPLVSINSMTDNGKKKSSKIKNLKAAEFDRSRQLFKFNVIKFRIDSRNNPKSIRTANVGGEETICEIIKNIRVGYPSSSHYRVDFGRNFSNIYGIRLLSTEIPNASYTFNGTAINSDFGKFNLSTKVNNKLRWIYKNNYIQQPKYNFYDSGLYFKNSYTNIINVKPSDNQKLISYLSYTQLDLSTNNVTKYIDNYYRYSTLLKCKYQDGDDVYKYNNLNYNIDYLGKLNDKGIDLPNEYNTKYLPNSLQILYPNLLPYINNIFNSYEYYLLNVPSYSLPENLIVESSTIEKIDYFYRMTVGPTSNETMNAAQYNFSNKLFNRYILSYQVNGYRMTKPFLIKLMNLTHSFSNPPDTNDTVLNFVVYKLFPHPTLLNTYTYDMILLNGMIDSNTNSYITDSMNGITTNGMIMVVQTEINNISISEFLKNNPYFYNHLKQFGTKTISLQIPSSFVKITDALLNETSYVNYENVDMSSYSISVDVSYNSSVFDLSGQRYSTILDYSDQPIIDPESNEEPPPWSPRTIITYSIPNYTFNYTSVTNNYFNHVNDISFNLLYGVNKIDLSNSIITFKQKTFYSPTTPIPSTQEYEFNDFYNNILQPNNNLIKFKDLSNNEIYFLLDTDSSMNTIGFDPSNNITYSYKYLQTNLEEIGTHYVFNYYLYNTHYKSINSIKIYDLSFNIIQNQLLQTKSSIIRFYNKNQTTEFIEFYLGANIQSDITGTVYELRYKNHYGKLNLFDGDNLYFILFEEQYNTYLRETIDNYLYMNFENIKDEYKKDVNLRMFRVNSDNGSVNDNPSINGTSFVNIMNPNVNTEYSNILDTPRYSILTINELNYNNGLILNNFNQEFIEETPTDNIIQFPIIDKTSDKLIIPFIITNDSRNGVFYIPDTSIYTRYPVYTSEIKPGKYIESTLTKYIDVNFNKFLKKNYDYSKEIFTETELSTRNTDLEYVYENGPSKFTIELDRNINTLKLYNYKKIYQTITTTTIDNKKNLYLNEGFPYAYFRVPEVSLSNGAFVKIEGLASIDNVTASELNKLHSIVIPKNYRMVVRQLLPLPSIDYLNSNKNMFPLKGKPFTIDYLTNLYTDFINNSIKKEDTKDLTIDLVMSRIFGLGESSYTDINDFSLRNILKSKTDLKKNSYFLKEADFSKENLNRAYVNYDGLNQSYTRVNGFNGQSNVDSTRNGIGMEYSGSAFINSSRNKPMLNEREKINEGDEEVLIKTGLETAFFENELFIKLSDVNESENYNAIGRINGITSTSDENGNFTIDYDLFTENGQNFKIGDIVIGMDSQTIGIILPSDYEYSNLPNDEIKILGLGAYILNNSRENLNTYFDTFYGIDSIYTRNRNLATLFMERLNNWQIIENKTKLGFYVKLNNIPNTSRLVGVTVANLIIYVPDFYKLLDGEDTPLSQFGFKNTYYNNSFNYFKDNSVPYESLLINRSYLKRYNNRDIQLIIETKQNGKFFLDDKVYFEDHKVLYNNLESRKNKYFSIDLLEPFSSFISKIEAIYNNKIVNFNTLNKVVYPHLQIGYYNNTKFILNDDYYNLFDTVYSPKKDLSENRLPIPFKNNIIVRQLNQDIKNYVYSYNFQYFDFSIDYIPDGKFYVSFIGNDISGIYVDSSTNILSSKYLDPSQSYLLTISNENSSAEYAKNNYTNGLFKLKTKNIDYFNDLTYFIKISAIRNTYAIKNTNYDSSLNRLNITNYDTLGVYERMMENYIQKIYSTFSFDLNKANMYDKKCNYNLYKNRIIKLRVCPIDNAGFSYEPVISGIPNVTSYQQRSCKGYSRKLFPYHEKKFILNHYNNPLGDTQLVLTGNYQTYGRIRQEITNNDYDIKQFLPGMGVYSIDSEDIYNTISTNTDQTSKVARFPGSFYDYKTSFLGYVLETSVENSSEYVRDYVLNKNSFSKVDLSNSVYSEYYIYLLVDPQITSKELMNRYFDKLNRDNIHLVFDGDAKNDYTTNYLNIDGVTFNKVRYKYDFSYANKLFTLKTSPLALDVVDDVVYSFKQNSIGTVVTMDNTDKNLTFYEDDKLITALNVTNIDAFTELIASNIIIKKPILNQTLPHYDYQFRKACATMTQRCVFYDSDISSNIRLFAVGDLDYYYKDYLKNKTVMNYKPILENSDLQFINNQQFIMENPKSGNFKDLNFKERNCHSRYIDSTYNNRVEYIRNGTYNTSDKDDQNLIQGTISFENGDDVVLFNTNQTFLQYQNTTKEYNKLNRAQNESLIKDNVKLGTNLFKVISGGLLPINYLPHSKIIENDLNTYLNNTALLDYNFDNNIEKFSRIPILGKTNGYELDILGNNSYLYRSENPTHSGAFYNEVEIDDWETIESTDLRKSFTNKIWIPQSIFKLRDKQISNFKSSESLNSNQGSNRLGSTDNSNIDVYNFSDTSFDYEINVKKLIGCIFISFSELSLANYKLPLYNPLKSELAIIKDAALVLKSQNTYVEITFENHLTNINELENPKFKNFNKHIIPYRRLFTALLDMSGNPYMIVGTPTWLADYTTIPYYDASNNPKPSSVYQWSIDKNYYMGIMDPSGYLESGDTIIVDYANTGYTKNTLSVVEYSQANEPLSIYMDNTVSDLNLKEITAQYKIVTITATMGAVRICQIDRPIVGHLPNMSIILLKDPLLPGNNETANNPTSNYRNDGYKIERNLLSTQPFTIFNKWYTKIFYKGSNYFDGTHYKPDGSKSKVLNNISNYLKNGGKDRISKYESKNVFIKGMKGFNLPYININKKYTITTIDSSDIEVYQTSSSDSFNVGPVQPGYYTTKPHIYEDFSPFLIIDSRNKKVNGNFASIDDLIRNPLSLDSILGNEKTWINNNNNNEFEYPYVVIEGFYLGYGGHIQERFNEDTTNMIINNDTGFNITNIQTIKNGSILSIKLPSIYNNLFNVIPQTSLLHKKSKNRNDNIPINIQNDYLDYFFNQEDFDENLLVSYNILEPFGVEGRVVKKKILTPYNLNPNNYIFLSIPDLNHIQSVQNNNVSGAFAKILLPGESNRVLYNTNVGGGKVYYDNLFNNLNELEIAFLTNDGYLFDFNGSEHSFAIEITEIIDKFEYINPKFGNIEI